jgi:ankyrin repeat protein
LRKRLFSAPQNTEPLLDNGADVYGIESVRNGYKITPLYLAAESGHVKTVQLLLSRGLSHKSPYDVGYEALYAAARAGNEVIARILVEAGANLSAPSRWHGTSLHHAAAGGSKSIVRLLLGDGVDLMARDHLESTPLHEAAGEPTVLQILLDHGADPNTRGQDKEIVLHYTVGHGCLASARLLLARGADPHAQDRLGGTSFYYLPVPERR